MFLEHYSMVSSNHHLNMNTIGLLRSLLLTAHSQKKKERKEINATKNTQNSKEKMYYKAIFASLQMQRLGQTTNHWSYW